MDKVASTEVGDLEQKMKALNSKDWDKAKKLDFSAMSSNVIAVQANTSEDFKASRHRETDFALSYKDCPDRTAAKQGAIVSTPSKSTGGT